MVDRLLDHYGGEAAFRRTQGIDVKILDAGPGVAIEAHSYCGSMEEKQQSLALDEKASDSADRNTALHDHEGDTPQQQPAAYSGLG